MAQKIVACILRNAGTGWYVLNDSEHRPIGVETVLQDPNGLTLVFDFVADTINTFLVGPDETFAKAGYSGGASVGMGSAYIQFGQNGVGRGPSEIVSASGNFWVYGLFNAGDNAAEPPPVTPPSGNAQTFTASGTFVVPAYTSALTVEMWGGGGGGFGDGTGSEGSDGGASRFLGLTAGGGVRGQTSSDTGGGLGGVASGGDINTNGQRGGTGSSGGPSGKGGDAPLGGVGGAAVKKSVGNAGQAPGGGGGGADNALGTTASGGGSGAYVKKTYAPGALVPGTIIPVTVGAGGVGGIGGYRGGDGARGEVRITWA
jgi:hypothetical protein